MGKEAITVECWAMIASGRECVTRQIFGPVERDRIDRVGNETRRRTCSFYTILHTDLLCAPLQMASTAAGVAVGSTMGHGLSNMLFGGGGSQQEVQAPVTPQEQSQFVQATNVGGKCDIQAKGTSSLSYSVSRSSERRADARERLM